MDGDTINTDNTTMNYTLSDLEEFTSYMVTMAVLSGHFVVGKNDIVVTTLSVGKYIL